MNESDEFKRQMLQGAMALQHGKRMLIPELIDTDFTQYYPENQKAHQAAVSTAV